MWHAGKALDWLCRVDLPMNKYLGTFVTCSMEVCYRKWAIVSSEIEFSVSQVHIMLVVRNVQRELKQPVN